MTGSEHEIALAATIGLTTLAQVMLRLGARGRTSLAASVLNVKSGLGYAIFCAVVLLGIFAMQAIPLRTVVAWNSLTYILTPLAARWLARDPLVGRTMLGSAVIALGILIYCL